MESRARIETWASAIRKRGDWITGIFDERARRRTASQGERLDDSMIDEHLDIFTEEADLEAAAVELNARIATKPLKVAANMTEWLA